jgi:hypothetical protein
MWLKKRMGLNLSSTSDFIGYISRPRAKRYMANHINAKAFNRVADAWNSVKAAFSIPAFATAVA